MLIKHSKKNFCILILFLVVLTNFYLVSNCQASAKDDWKTQMDNAAKPSWGGPPSANTTLAGIVKIAVSAFLGLLGIIFLILIIYAGFNWMTAGGDEEKVTLAKNTLTRAVIGLVIITAAYAITYFVFNSLPGGGGGGAQTGSVY